MMEKKICPKCKGEMEKQEPIDEKTAPGGSRNRSSSATSPAGIGSRSRYIKSFRCIECGYVMKYNPMDDPKERERFLREKLW